MKCLAIDVGGTYIKFAGIEDGKILWRGKRPTPKDDLPGFMNLLTEIYQGHEKTECIGISIPGRVDCVSGTILTGGALGYIEGLKLKERLEHLTQVPVYAENDAKCAALAELQSGSLLNCKNGIVYLIGTGIGGGVIVNGSLYKGSSNFAGEFSYINVAYDYSFPQKLSEFCAVPALLDLASKKLEISLESIDGALFFEKVLEGRRQAIEVLEEFSRRVAVSLFNLQCAYDAEKIAIGGGVSSQPILIQSIRSHVTALYDSMAEQLPRPEVVVCKYKNDANLLGAIYAISEQNL